MDTVEFPTLGRTFAIIDGTLPDSSEWERIRTEGMGINVLTMPDSRESLADLEPSFAWLTHLAVNSSSCVDLRLVERFSRLEWLAIGGLVRPSVPASGLSSLTYFGGPSARFPGILDLPSLEEIRISWSEPLPPRLGSPLRRVQLLDARKLTGLPEFAHPELVSTLGIHGSAHLSLAGISSLRNLGDLRLDHCRMVESVGELLQLPELKVVTLEDCPSIDDFWDLQNISARVRVVGRNPFVSGFRSAVDDARWDFPPGRRYLPADEKPSAEYLAHPGLDRALRVPDEASENNPWAEHLTDAWLRLSETQKLAALEQFLERILEWAAREGANRAVVSGGAAEFDVRQLALAAMDHDLQVFVGDRLLVAAPDGLHGGFLVTSPVRLSPT